MSISLSTTASAAPLKQNIIYVPDFCDVSVDSAIADGTRLGLETARNFLQDQNWITRDLLVHLEQFYPQDGDITPGSGIRNPEAFKRACSSVFEKGCIYASSKQLTQVSQLLLDKWGAKSVSLGKKICCFYHAPQKNKVVAGAQKKYNVQPSQKELVQCPFFISYSLIDFIAHKKHPLIFHHVRVTNTDFPHTCQLSPTYLRQAKKRLTLILFWNYFVITPIPGRCHGNPCTIRIRDQHCC
jgi:hypothetical protein